MEEEEWKMLSLERWIFERDIQALLKDCADGRIMKPYEFWLDKMMEEEWEDRRYWPLRKSSFVRETLALFGNYAQ